MAHAGCLNAVQQKPSRLASQLLTCGERAKGADRSGSWESNSEIHLETVDVSENSSREGLFRVGSAERTTSSPTRAGLFSIRPSDGELWRSTKPGQTPLELEMKKQHRLNCYASIFLPTLLLAARLARWSYKEGNSHSEGLEQNNGSDKNMKV